MDISDDVYHLITRRKNWTQILYIMWSVHILAGQTQSLYQRRSQQPVWFNAVLARDYLWKEFISNKLIWINSLPFRPGPQNVSVLFFRLICIYRYLCIRKTLAVYPGGLVTWFCYFDDNNHHLIRDLLTCRSKIPLIFRVNLINFSSRSFNPSKYAYHGYLRSWPLLFLFTGQLNNYHTFFPCHWKKATV